MLELVGLERRYEDTVALDGLTMSVPAGVVFGFLGPNGSGKTTAMRAVMGVTGLDRGEVRWNGKVLDRKARKRFGYMPEERALYPDMLVREHLVFFARLHGLTKADAQARADEWLDRLSLTERANDKVSALSQGNRQRVQVANALVHDPEVMLLDEPFNGLDPLGIDFLAAVLAERAAQGCTVLFSSHQLDVVEHICSQVAIVHRGRLVAAGTTRDITAPTGRRLTVEVAGARKGWASRLKGVTVISADEDRLDLELSDVADPTRVLDVARKAGEIREWAQSRRRLSEVFVEAVG